jgi:hypothetical protein
VLNQAVAKAALNCPRQGIHNCCYAVFTYMMPSNHWVLTGTFPHYELASIRLKPSFHLALEQGKSNSVCMLTGHYPSGYAIPADFDSDG